MLTKTPGEMYDDQKRKVNILNNVKDLVGSLLYHDRKEDEDLPNGAIETAIEKGEITADEIVECFKKELTSKL